MIYYFTVLAFRDSFNDNITWHGIDNQCDEVFIDLDRDFLHMTSWEFSDDSHHYIIRNYMDNQNYEYHFRR